MVEAAGGFAAERPRISPEFGVESKFSRHGGAIVPAALSSGGVYYVPFCVFMYVTSKKVASRAPLVSFEGCSADSHGRSSRADRLRPIRFVRRRWTCTRQTRACRSEAGWWVWPAGGRAGGRTSSSSSWLWSSPLAVNQPLLPLTVEEPSAESRELCRCRSADLTNGHVQFGVRHWRCD